MPQTGLIERLESAMTWRLRRLVGPKRLDAWSLLCARFWRLLLLRPVNIAIAGSAGKTTTKALASAVLAELGSCSTSPESLNTPTGLARHLLRTWPWQRFSVAELSEHVPGVMAQHLRLFRPKIAVVTCVGEDHLSAFGSRDDIAAEIDELVRALPADGVAILNADDPRVAAMAASSRCRVITVGTDVRADLHAVEIGDGWPSPCVFVAEYAGQRVSVETRLYGRHWVTSALAAIAVGLAVGLSLDAAARRIASVAPVPGRMEVIEKSGIVFVRDDFKAPYWSLETCLGEFRQHPSPQKILVLGEISDVPGGKERCYRGAVGLASELFEIVIVVGPWALGTLGSNRNTPGCRLFAVRHVREAATLVAHLAEPGAVVLLKGGLKTDHLERIVSAWDGPVSCWRDDCRMATSCAACYQRHRVAGPPATAPDIGALIAYERRHRSANAAGAASRSSGRAGIGDGGAAVRVVVGVGNPGPEFANTPHSLGYRVVDACAARHGWQWRNVLGALIAEGCIHGRPVTLVKAEVAVNNSGRRLVELAAELDLNPTETLLVSDDLALVLGQVKFRQRGGDGGHRGVASVLEAFQSERFARLKVGAGSRRLSADDAHRVTRPFSPGDQPLVEQAVAAAGVRLEQLLAYRPGTGSGGTAGLSARRREAPST